MKRILRIATKSGNIDLNITKAVSIKSPKKMFMVEEMKDGGYRLTWSDSLICNFSDIEGFEIIREDSDNE